MVRIQNLGDCPLRLRHTVGDIYDSRRIRTGDINIDRHNYRQNDTLSTRRILEDRLEDHH